MTYKSKLTMILKMEEEKERNIKEDLRRLTEWKQTLEAALTKEKEQVAAFWEALRKGASVSSSFFSQASDYATRLKKEKEIKDIQHLLLLKNQEYQAIKKKIERLRTVDAEREKEYLREIEKKEEREIEEVKTMRKHLKKGGE